MDTLTQTPGMVTVLMAVVALEIVSVLIMLLVVYFYRKQAKKYRYLLVGLGNTEALKKAGRFLLPLYIVLTIVMALIAIVLFAFQPHLS